MSDLQVLLLAQLGVHTTKSHELIVATRLDNRCILDHQDQIRVLNRAQMMCNHDGGTALTRLVQCFLDQLPRL